MINLNRLKNKTILLVEDEKIIRDNIASLLKNFFKEVYTAQDGLEGFEQYEKFLPDIVMSDLKMPNMTGFELVTEIKNRFGNPFTIIVSAYTDTQNLLDAINSGNIDKYIVKPLNEEKLFNAFESYLETLGDGLIEISKEDNIKLNVDSQILLKEDEEHRLNKKELLLLKLLASDKNSIFSYEQIEYQVWGEKSMSISALRSVVRDLRKKLGENYIINISGNGYKLQ